MYAKRTKTYTAAEIIDADGIKTSIATSTSVVAWTVADWNGAVLNATTQLDLPRTITISRSSAANQYSVEPIVLTGMRNGVVVTESLTPANDDGNDILRGTQAFDALTNIEIPAQAGTGGAFTVGVGDICAPGNGMFCGFIPGSAANVGLAYGGTDTTVVNTDVIPIPAVAIGFQQLLHFRRLVSATTTASVTLLIP